MVKAKKKPRVKKINYEWTIKVHVYKNTWTITWGGDCEDEAREQIKEILNKGYFPRVKDRECFYLPHMILTVELVKEKITK